MEGEGASRTGARGGARGVTPMSSVSRGARERSPARHDETRPAHAPLTPNPRLEVGAWFSEVEWSRDRRKSVRWRAKLPFGIEPESVVPPRATRDVRGRARPREAPPATWRGGSASGAIRSTVGGSERTHNGTMHRAMRARTEAGALYRAPPRRDSPARTAGIVDSLLRPNGGDASST